jgi:hypothetical protein
MNAVFVDTGGSVVLTMAMKAAHHPSADRHCQGHDSLLPVAVVRAQSRTILIGRSHFRRSEFSQKIHGP